MFLIAFVVLLLFKKCSHKHRKAILNIEVPKKHLAICVISFITWLLYIILVCSKAGSGYISRPDVLFGGFFFAMLFVFICLSWILRVVPMISLILPLIILVALFSANTNGATFVESSVGNTSPEIAKAVTEDIIEQVQSAVAAGDEAVEVSVPVYSRSDNWPLATYGGSYISRSLLKLGLIDKSITVTLVPDEEMNLKYGIEIPESA